jgi:hypothetical protein
MELISRELLCRKRRGTYWTKRNQENQDSGCTGLKKPEKVIG